VGRSGSPPRQQVAQEEKSRAMSQMGNHFMNGKMRHLSGKINAFL
jgi:hypothetical protein